MIPSCRKWDESQQLEPKQLHFRCGLDIDSRDADKHMLRIFRCPSRTRFPTSASRMAPIYVKMRGEQDANTYLEYSTGPEHIWDML